MRIGVDARPLRERQTSGIPMYVRSMLRNLAKIDHENEYVLYAHKDFDFELPNARWSKHTNAVTRYGSVWMQVELPFWIRRDRLDLFWSTQHILPLAMPRTTKAVLTVHDLVHFVFPKTMKRVNFLINKLIIPPSVHRADTIVTISNWTMSEVRRFLAPQNKLMEVTHLGVADHFFPRNLDAARERVKKEFGLPEHFLLTVGTFEPRKNVEGTFRAFTKIAERIPHHLAIVGQRGWKNKRVINEIESSRFRNRIHLLGFVSDDLLPDVYSAADVFIYPSLYEGFGFPPIEAMACGVPVVCSNVSSIPEIVGDAALLVDPYDPDEFATSIMAVIEKPSLRYELIGRGLHRASSFSWSNTARQMLEIFHRTYDPMRK